MKLSRSNQIKAEEIAKKYNISVDDVKLIILSQYELIKEKTREINIPDDTTEEEFNKLKTNFNIPCIGKLYASYYLWRRLVNNKNKNKK